MARYTQRSVLGPFLFAVLINSFCPIHPDTICVKYADDITFIDLYCRLVVDKLHKEWSSLQKWAQDHNFTNANCNTSATLPLQAITNTDGAVLEEVTSLKILGLLISNDLKWNLHIDHCLTRALKQMHLLRVLRQFQLRSP